MIFSILKRLPLFSPPFVNVMASSSFYCGVQSKRFLVLAQQLRHYKPPPCSWDDNEERIIEEAARKFVSQVGFQESVTRVAQNPEKFRPKRASVLICLFEGDAGDLRVILTKRSSRLSTHSGEVSLPGGKADEGDKDDGDTATREAKEEIGLDPSLVNVITVLEPFLSKGTFCLKINIDIILKFDLTTINRYFGPAEVDAVFDAPLEMFIKDENRSAEEREWMGEKYLLHFFDYEIENKRYLIWGLTAGILIRAASVVYQRPPAFLEQSPKFKFPGLVDK
ncbi:hypothetical protein ES319_A06G132700v1 [Gossypium barbadense]|uniref:Nudix hydrolase domain-containing protein n=1 Tax=Gossypium barbadense TaxID=3634 RepID=A0A5J5VE74_GOSBA|nr:hypothetical protein ES319_A06G132700v1 [Gossypium barbadense]